jgi:hypothetical protein
MQQTVDHLDRCNVTTWHAWTRSPGPLGDNLCPPLQPCSQTGPNTTSMADILAASLAGHSPKSPDWPSAVTARLAVLPQHIPSRHTSLRRCPLHPRLSESTLPFLLPWPALRRGEDGTGQELASGRRVYVANQQGLRSAWEGTGGGCRIADVGWVAAGAPVLEALCYSGRCS